MSALTTLSTVIRLPSTLAHVVGEDYYHRGLGRGTDVPHYRSSVIGYLVKDEGWRGNKTVCLFSFFTSHVSNHPSSRSSLVQTHSRTDLQSILLQLQLQCRIMQLYNRCAAKCPPLLAALMVPCDDASRIMACYRILPIACLLCYPTDLSPPRPVFESSDCR